MKKKDGKLGFIISFILVVLLFVVGIIIFINKIIVNNKYEVSDKLVTLSVNDSDVINIKNMLPLSDDVGKQIKDSDSSERQDYYDFSIKSNSDVDVNYEIYLTNDSKSENIIRAEYVKVYLTDDKNNPYDIFDKNSVPTFYDLKVSKTDPAGKQLFKGKIKSKKVQKFRLRLWLADNYVISTKEESFEAKVHVKVY